MFRYPALGAAIVIAFVAIFHPPPRQASSAVVTTVSPSTPPRLVQIGSGLSRATRPYRKRRRRARHRTRHRSRRTRKAIHSRHRFAGIVSVNTASADVLARVPGIGVAIAARIVTVREQEGAYASFDELLDVAGMTASRLDRARQYLSL